MTDRIEAKIDALANAVASGFKELRGEMGELRGEMGEVRNELSGEIKIVDQKVDSLRTEMIAMHFDYKKIIARVEKLGLTAFGGIQE